MNQQQRKYAKERVSAIYARRKQELINRHTTEASHITESRRAALIKSGEVKLRKGVTEIDSYSKVCRVFDFSKYEKEATVNRAALDKATALLVSEMNKVNDEIMLGDEAEALKLISSFDV